jgi:uncharacterized protein YjbI with pentapeptide repeats
MADARQLEYLQANLEHPTGRRRWVEFKLKAKWIDLSGAELNQAALRNFDFSEVNLSTALLEGIDLTAADLTDANLTLSQLTGACLRDACLERAQLTGANLSSADLSDARLEGAVCYNCNLAGANLIGADLAGADLREADLRGACLKYVRLSGALLDGANVEGADMNGCVLDPDAPQHLLNFDSASIDDRRYRQMRNTFNALFGDIEVAEAAQAGLPVVARRKRQQLDPEEIMRSADSTGAFRRRVNSAAEETQGSNPKNDGGTGGSSGGDTGDDKGNTGPYVPRDIEPDLTTVEGCCLVLEIQPDAPMDEVVKAFRKKAKIYHPDKVGHLNPKLQELAAEEFRRLHMAYEGLTRRTTRPLDGVIWAVGVPKRTSPYEYSSAEYEQLVRVNPGSTCIIYNLAWKYFEEGRPYDAKVWFEKLLQMNPNDEDAKFNLMVVRLYMEVQVPLLGG